MTDLLLDQSVLPFGVIANKPSLPLTIQVGKSTFNPFSRMPARVPFAGGGQFNRGWQPFAGRPQHKKLSTAITTDKNQPVRAVAECHSSSDQHQSQ